MRTVTRPFRPTYSPTHQLVTVADAHPRRPATGGALMMPPWFRPVATRGDRVFAGMDPSDPSTWVRRWNPQPGMIARLNFDGSQIQGRTEMGGVWGLPAWADVPVGGRPHRRPR